MQNHFENCWRNFGQKQTRRGYDQVQPEKPSPNLAFEGQIRKMDFLMSSLDKQITSGLEKYRIQ